MTKMEVKQRMRIAEITATPVSIPVEFDVCGSKKNAALGICIVEITTDQGQVGVGMTAITEEEVIACIVNDVASHMFIGEDPLATEKLWNQLYWLLTPRGQSGYASHAIAAIDIALWDLKGKILDQPIWSLLGGSRSRVPTYATIGFDFFEREQLAEVARTWKDKGFDKFKMVVGHNGLKRKDEPRPIREVLIEDIKRVELLRETVGNTSEIFIDANCNLDPYHAEWLANRVDQYDISFFEEPITQNDSLSLAELRKRIKIPLAGGQNEGQAGKFRDLLVNRSLDILQPNVAITGGFSQCIKIAGMAEAFNVGIDNGGAWPFHNMHLHGGLRNGGMVEYHIFAVECLKQIFDDLPVPQEGWLTLPSSAGLGFSLNKDALKDLAKAPTSHGAGK